MALIEIDGLPGFTYENSMVIFHGYWIMIITSIPGCRLYRLDMSRRVLRSTFASVLTKKVDQMACSRHVDI